MDFNATYESMSRYIIRQFVQSIDCQQRLFLCELNGWSEKSGKVPLSSSLLYLFISFHLFHFSFQQKSLWMVWYEIHDIGIFIPIIWCVICCIYLLHTKAHVSFFFCKHHSIYIYFNINEYLFHWIFIFFSHLTHLSHLQLVRYLSVQCFVLTRAV